MIDNTAESVLLKRGIYYLHFPRERRMPRQTGVQVPAAGCGREAGAGVRRFHPGLLGVGGQASLDN